MERNSSKFFSNIECEWYPCHKDIEDLNCLYCYCPIYYHCGTRAGGKECKDCLFPHDPKMHDAIQQCIVNIHKKEVSA